RARRRPSIASHDDVDARGYARTTAGRDVLRYRLGFAAPLCGRHRGWLRRLSSDEHFPLDHGLRLDRARVRQAARARGKLRITQVIAPAALSAYAVPREPEHPPPSPGSP